MCLSKINKFKYNWHNAKNSYHSSLFTNAVSSGGAIFFSSKSYFSCWGTAFLRRVYFVCWGACLFSFFEELLCMLYYLFLASSKVWFSCGVAWLVGLLGLWRGDLLSLAFSVSINKLEVYE